MMNHPQTFSHVLDNFHSEDSSKLEGKIIAFTQCLWIFTTNRWNNNAGQAIQHQNPSVACFNPINLVMDSANWTKLERGNFGVLFRPKPFAVQFC